jgi:hypothetical protein
MEIRQRMAQCGSDHQMQFGKLTAFACSFAVLSGCSGAEHPGSPAVATGGAASQGGQGTSSGGSTGSGGATGSGRGPGSTVSGDATKVSASIIVRDVPPGEDRHVCVVLALPVDAPTWINEIHASLNTGSHHLIVDRRVPGSPVEPEPTECGPTMGGEDSRLLIAQQKDTRLTLPEGVAFQLAARQGLFLQLHYVNTGSEPETIVGAVDFMKDTITASPTEAKSLFTGSLGISLAPLSKGQAQAFFTPQPESGTRHVFAVTSHTHRLGIRSTIEHVPSMSAPESTPIHVSTDWAEPPLTVLSPMLDFTTQSTDGFRLVCRYDNTTNTQVTFGTRASDEMCFMWVYYFDR